VWERAQAKGSCHKNNVILPEEAAGFPKQTNAPPIRAKNSKKNQSDIHPKNAIEYKKETKEKTENSNKSATRTTCLTEAGVANSKQSFFADRLSPRDQR
jgi:hypothetical protein